MIHTITLNDSPASLYIAQMRDTVIQKDPMRFRTNIKRLSHILAYEIGKTLKYSPLDVTTPLGTAKCRALDDKVVVACIFRAALPMHEGFLDIFDNAESAFLAEYRSYNADGGFDIKSGYVASPSLDGKVLIIADPMLATGGSLELGYHAFSTKGVPATVHLCSVIAAQKGVDYIKKAFADYDNVTLWCAAIDPELNEHCYIVPGLGDAGDLAYGDKL